MAIFRKDTQAFSEDNKTQFDVVMLAGANGSQINTIYRLPVDIGNTSISISGNVNVNTPNTVTIQSSPEDPVDIHIRQVGNSGILNVPYLPIGGNVIITSGNIVLGANVTAYINNFPTSQNVVVTSGNLVLAANVTAYINNFPTSQNVVVTSGNLILGANVTAYINNFPTSFNANLYYSNGTAVSNTNPMPISGNVNAVMITSSNTPALVKYADSYNTQLDAVGRLRVSPPIQSYWYTPTVDKDGDLRYQEAFQNNANSYFIQNLAQIRMTSGNTYNANTSLTGSAIRLTRRRFAMRPNVSLEWFGALNWSGAETNVTKRRGLYTQYNGVFFEVSNGDISFNIRRRLEDGTITVKTIARSDWNVDKLDGTNSATNPTGKNINPATSAQSVTISGVASKSGPFTPQNSTENYYRVVFNTSSTASLTWQSGQHVVMSGLSPSTLNGHGMFVASTANTVTISYLGDPGTYTSGTGLMYSDGMYNSYSWWIDFNGSRTNRIRFGIQGADSPQVCHIEDFTGILGTRWSNAPAMPDRMEIFNTGVPNYDPAMFIGSSSISTEAEALLNPAFGLAIHDSSVSFNKTTDVNNEYAILGVGLRSGEPYQRADLQIQQIQLADLGNLNNQQAAIMQWRLVLNPTYAGTAVPAANNIGKATRQWSFANGTTISGGVTLLGGYFQGTQTQETRTALNFLNMGSNVDNSNADIVVLACKMLVGGSSSSLIAGGFDIIESL
ncbi:hypothetical protein UFOVP247_40 [uncultured Caudovirales phage]|uniref:Uncharacterized protein n=1 Tax=uncultured Caudovirales phage TaxID=2100421 RepID=A0A6J7WXI4_9CAUD|nr:hypothetical protein UFOVP247_40 [uncultured Caudovirales phage]